MAAHMLGNAIEQHHRQRPPFHDRLVTGLECFLQQGALLGPQSSRIDQQPAIAILGQASQRIERDDLESRAFDRLDQRVAHPLRSL